MRNDPSNVVTLAELTLFREQVAASTKDAVEIVRAQTTGVVSARSGKSSQSIVEKLRRQKTLKLSQMQDIEGCRIVVDSITEQDALASRIHAVFDDVVVHDRRKNPSFGYRAIHVVPRLMGERYEVQIRTRLQHVWAEVAERLAGSFGQELKYGEGPEEARSALIQFSELVHQVETEEAYLIAAWTGRKLTDDELARIASGFFRDHLRYGSRTDASEFESLAYHSGLAPLWNAALALGETSWEETPDLDAVAERFIYKHYEQVQVQRVLYRSVLESKRSLRDALLSIIPE